MTAFITSLPQNFRSSYFSHVIAATTSADEYCHLRRTDYWNTLNYAHTILRTVQVFGIILRLLLLLAPEVGGFVELILLWSLF